MKLIEVMPRDIYFLIEFSLEDLTKLKRVSELLIAKQEQSVDDTIALNFLDEFFKEVDQILKETGNASESIRERSKL